MKDEVLVNSITNCRNFRNGVNRIHYAIYCSINDASNLLLQQTLKRVHYWECKDKVNLIAAFTDKSNPEFKNKQWAITYAAKDVVEDYYGHKTLLVEDFDKSDELGQLEPINCRSSVSIENSLVNKVSSLFPTNKTKMFVKSLLKYGKTATMDIFSMTEKKFEHALYDRIAYVKSNAQMFNEKFSGFEQQDTLDKLKVLGDFEYCLNKYADPMTLNSEVHALFIGNSDVFNDVFDYAAKKYGMKYQGIVWESFGMINDHELKLDEYKLIDSIIDLQQELSKQFVPTEGQVSLYEATYLS
ncbi:hypothetical protein FEZ41_12440 [Lentilactobacillus parafarraginis]|uniref:Uncharacterized protein n=1 Tax=Lentilactobacillus parafarraginis TaxID=390842 RepID=A0A5R9CNV1_9LACO|nr:hypothetical protein [Lentilactobacillus parafarraginis]TLQ17005.1 hypothetical protein FEZ41_12440 [Lentilactobacillus parafarraginis]